jgi:hypothetical protein
MTDLPEPDERTPNCAICLARGHYAPATHGPRLYCAACWASASASRSPTVETPPAGGADNVMLSIARRVLTEAAYAPPQPGESIH